MSSSKGNINQKQGRGQAFNFLQAIFGSQAGGFLEIRAFPSDKDKPIQNFFSIPSELKLMARKKGNGQT